MNKKTSGSPAAVIEIGSGVVRMVVSQLKRGEIDTIDRLEYPVTLGHEIFSGGRISFESLNLLSGILKKFTKALEAYDCKHVRVVSSTVMREAENRSFIADQIRIHNGLQLEILEYSEEKALICTEIIRFLQQESKTNIDNTLIAYIGTGSIGISLYNGKGISVSQNVPIGSMKLYDNLRQVSRESDAFHEVVSEYLDTILDHIDVPKSEIQNIILTGSEVELVGAICSSERSGDVYAIPAKRMHGMYQEIRSLSFSAIARNYHISEEQAKSLYSALAIYTAMLRLSEKTKTVLCPDIDLCDAITRQMLLPGAHKEYQEQIFDSAKMSAAKIAEKYNCNPTHSEAIRVFSCKLFDKMKEYHGLPDDRKIILELAALLHSCGQYINMRIHNHCSFDLIKNLDIFGMTQEQILKVAYVSGYEEMIERGAEDLSALTLTEEKRLEISKLVALFRLANAMDKSKRQKLTLKKIKISNDIMEIKADTTSDALLEKWAFEEASALFMEVFGLKPQLIVRNNLL